MKMMILVLLPVVLLAIPAEVASYGFYRASIPNGERVRHPCDTNQTWYGVGHDSDQGGNNLNAFGLDFRLAGYNWTLELCLKDSDNDGKTNGEELGDPQCIWRRGQEPQETENITHPGFKTPVEDFPYNIDEAHTVNCDTFFVRCAVFDDPDVVVLDLRIPKGNSSVVPAKETTYYNYNFELPNDRVYHAVAFEPIIDNRNVMHHFVLNTCLNPVQTNTGYENFNVLPGCEETMYSWSFGQTAECLPDEAGVAFGQGYKRFVQLQIHWTNIAMQPNWRDTSGVRVYYTRKLRKYSTGSLLLGQMALAIPGNKPSTIQDATCASHCTQAFFDQGAVHVISISPHMHFLGRSMTVDHSRDGQKSRLVHENTYNYNSPAVYHFQPNTTEIRPGDALHTQCEFNSQGRNQTTRWGFASKEEMCYAFVRYYPRRGILICLQFHTADLCFPFSYVDGPRCSLFSHNENITQAVSRAISECDQVIQTVKTSEPSSTAVCTPSCLNQLGRVLKAYQDPCQQTRHKDEWRLLHALLAPQVATLGKAAQHCQTVGLVTQSPAGTTVPTINPILLGKKLEELAGNAIHSQSGASPISVISAYFVSLAVNIFVLFVLF